MNDPRPPREGRNTPSEPPTAEHIDRLLDAIHNQTAERPEILDIRDRTLARLRSSPFAVLTLRDEDANPLTWLQQHPGDAAAVVLSVADSAHGTNVQSIEGQLQVCGESNSESTAAEQTDVTRPVKPERRALTGAGLMFELGAASAPSPKPPATTPIEPEAVEPIADKFELPPEQFLTLTLPGLPSSHRLATSSAFSFDHAERLRLEATGIWPYLQKLLPPRTRTKPAGDATESTSSRRPVTRLVADSRTPNAPFASATSADRSVSVKLFDNGRLLVDLASQSPQAEHLLVAELAVDLEDGPQQFRYLIDPLDRDVMRVTADGTTVIERKIRTPLNAVSSEVKLTLRSLDKSDVCLLNEAQRERLFGDLPLTSLTVRESGDSTYELSVFKEELDELAAHPDSVVLFRLVEREGAWR